ncbi:MAG: UDP-glucuronate 5-epimerase, partial [Lentisphaerota bacterium]
MIEIIENELGMKAEKEMLPMQLGDVPESFADIDKARLKLGFEPKTPILEGIPAFISWYNKHPDLAQLVAKNR